MLLGKHVKAALDVYGMPNNFKNSCKWYSCVLRKKNVQSLHNNDNDSNIIKLMDMLYISYMLLKMVNNKLLVTEKSISDLCCRL